ncbi:hypothetical protein [Umezawaea sp. Da 62-37]|uniref:preQ(1) synthase n=1 Tax=Umezawaea sp. Da 62-37 TaxID=3075927 RepID=UPI0028F6F773|nr:hypothetical protein [Umezawaea sp. Da 62-37]WNV87997.1 hypothetical protein RM788_06835 [Umezawaea sp. Da 62-37]
MPPDDSPTAGLTLLGRPTNHSEDTGLEVFPAPANVTSVTFTGKELTARCPVTGQPDFYSLVLTYHPIRSCVESKSLKLYLTRFRDQEAFCEGLAALVLGDVVAATRCGPASVVLRQQVRGGLELTARADHEGGADVEPSPEPEAGA